MTKLAVRLSAPVVVALLWLSPSPRGAEADRAQAADQQPLALRVMTYNLRYASDTPPNSWPERRPLVKKTVLQAAPDVIGTQEGVYRQLQDLAADLSAYHWIGLGREGGSRGEFMAVFYRHARFVPVAFDHFWLSDTPEVIGSVTWGHTVRRMLTWVRLRDKTTGRELLVWNTHLDHQVEDARRKGAALIRERLARTDPGVPLVLTGDFNCPAAGCVAYETLTREAGLTDAWLLAERRENEGIDTFNGFKAPGKGGVRIDWILLRGPAAVSRAATLTDSGGGRFPSDHFPVVADVRF
ncbi:MAG TPA: endonuclease/exonuclease/phosphatase family protein [Vicinamibacterales bacterium]|nr:endonuclease/exonuclease/phosphatase family protein [Vicinamibacterales bacterium]